MKQIIIILILIAFCGMSFGKQVDENTVKIIGQNFLAGRTNSQALKAAANLELIYKVASKENFPSASITPATYFYIFNAVSANGFVIISGDDCVFPILGYSDEIRFDPNHIPQNTAKWMECYKNEIRYAIETGIPATDAIKAEWKNLLDGKNNDGVQGVTGVNPLVQTKWDQSPYVNDLCPYDTAAGSQNGYHCVTGCPATAMAQIMKYWNYPATGTGFHSYNHSTYGTLSANFGGTSYDWTSMPNVVSSANNAAATLMYHCGVAVEMGYGPTSSGSYVIISKSPTPEQCSEYAYKTYFGYDASSVQGKERIDYTDANWIALLKNELDAGRPIQYAGFGGGAGHTFVCDGYDNNNMFHMNWGWGGYADGNFLISSLNPGGGGTGSGTGTYNQGQQAVIGIKPPAGNQSYIITLYNYVTPSPSTISYGQPFSVSTNIWNNGTNNFNGDYCAAIFDDRWNFVDYVETKTGWSLTAGNVYSTDITFSNAGLLTMLPGTYYVGIYYKPAGSDWIYVSDNGSYANFVPISVYYSNDIELNSAMAVTPGTTLTQGQSASVNVNIRNDGSSTFYGTYSADLYNLDGTWVEEIGTVTESNGLLSGYTYISPYLTFSASAVTASPGTYLLAIQHIPSGGNWTLTGSSYFQNPIYVTVKAPSISPDMYEVNETAGQAYNLPISFSGNNTVKNTQGSNCHVGNDYDYYKINLPAGYNYTITARLHDSYNSGNGNPYSLDAQFTYSTDGSTWSDSYDDVMPNAIAVSNGGMVYFFASPYFIGQTGTYLLDMSITRTAITGITEINNSDFVKLFPSPAKDFITVDLRELNEPINQIQILNAQGQQILSMDNTGSQKSVKLPLHDFPEGIYFIRIQTGQQIINRKMMVHP